ncbi:MAG TPA: M14 family zinc carboxypeptidase, partial [Anaerolineaceae bacterium]|nr:M14 family zinc carboxypeptidase [Anaerolineaceae bacterium]
MKRKNLLGLLAALVLLAAPLAAASSQSPLPEPVQPEPYPNSDIYPAVVLVDDPADWQTLRDLNTNIEGVRAADGGTLGAQFEPVIVTVYVNEKEAGQLKAAGVETTPIPNEGLRARILDGYGILEPSGWPTYAQYQTRLQTIATTYPAITRLVSIGKSVQNRDIWCLKISDNPDVEEDEPEVKFSSSIHGDEVTGMEMTLRFAEYLTGNYATDTTISGMVNGMEIWLCPMHNPDGYVAVSRFNANGEDLNRNFPEALNGDANSPGGLEAENQVFWNFEQAHTFVMGANYHGGAQVANYPWDGNHGTGGSCIASPDDGVFYVYSKGYAAL